MSPDMRTYNRLAVSERHHVSAQVDMTWSGHVHVYERTCPILYHTCLGYSDQGIPNAPVHMAIGNGGVRSNPCFWRNVQSCCKHTASHMLSARAAVAVCR